eukprot:TRINITY_DN94791_c0_g1_i1.p1 TRINITY_DN94791_c0_g1~~TRINITY_DN94791_c0_g1_i1.p1  ORF type:complete len:678 (-),score=97.93 TRINITY_DN94791_c0_g1_i1:405-2213(-)
MTGDLQEEEILPHGFGSSSCGSRPPRQRNYPALLSIQDWSYREKMPNLVQRLAHGSLHADGVATFDTQSLRSIDPTFIKEGFKSCNLNKDCRRISNDQKAEIQLAIDATSHAKPNFFDGAVVLATRRCLTSLTEVLVNSKAQPCFHVWRVGDALVLSTDEAEWSKPHMDVSVSYRGNRFAALCTGDVLPPEGRFPSYHDMLEFELGARHNLLVVSRSDAQDHRMPEVLVEVKLMKHPKYRGKESNCRFTYLRNWLQASFSMHEHFLIGLHDENYVEGFLKSQSCRQFPDYFNLLDMGRRLDSALTTKFQGKNLWDPEVLFGWLSTVLDFVKVNTEPGCAYSLCRPSASDADDGAGFLSLSQCPQLWSECPDVFSHVLHKVMGHEACVMDSIRAFLRVHTGVKTKWPQIRSSPTNHHCHNHQIILLEFSRNPKSFFDALNACPKLQACKSALETVGLSSLLPDSGAHIFVSPGTWHAALDAISREDWNLKKRHVIVAEEFEDTVKQAVAHIPSRDQVRLKCREATGAEEGVAPEQAASSQRGKDAKPQNASKEDQEIFPDLVVKRTFLYVPIESSIYSGPSVGAKTVSTSDGDPRVKTLPRKA